MGLKSKPLFWRFILSFGFAFLVFGITNGVEVPLESLDKKSKVAYVNMHKIFEAFPETEQARFELNKEIEEKKLEITEKKEEIAKLKGEIESLLKRTPSVRLSTTSKIDLQESSDTAKTPSNITEPSPKTLTSLTVPEKSPLRFLFTPPEESTDTVALETSTSSVENLSHSTSPSLSDVPLLEPQIREKEVILLQKETDLEAFIGAAEEEVRKLEEGKTMTLLARIYKSLEEISVKEGYSIIVEKKDILYGESAVDITESVIWRLKR